MFYLDGGLQHSEDKLDPHPKNWVLKRTLEHLRVIPSCDHKYMGIHLWFYYHSIHLWFYYHSFNGNSLVVLLSLIQWNSLVVLLSLIQWNSLVVLLSLTQWEYTCGSIITHSMGIHLWFCYHSLNGNTLVRFNTPEGPLA